VHTFITFYAYAKKLWKQKVQSNYQVTAFLTNRKMAKPGWLNVSKTSTYLRNFASIAAI